MTVEEVGMIAGTTTAVLALKTEVQDLRVRKEVPAEKDRIAARDQKAVAIAVQGPRAITVVHDQTVITQIIPITTAITTVGPTNAVLALKTGAQGLRVRREVHVG